MDLLMMDLSIQLLCSVDLLASEKHQPSLLPGRQRPGGEHLRPEPSQEAREVREGGEAEEEVKY